MAVTLRAAGYSDFLQRFSRKWSTFTHTPEISSDTIVMQTKYSIDVNAILYRS